MRVKLFRDIYLVFEVSVYDSYIEMEISNARSIIVDTSTEEEATTKSMLDSLYKSGYADISYFDSVCIKDK